MNTSWLRGGVKEEGKASYINLFPFKHMIWNHRRVFGRTLPFLPYYARMLSPTSHRKTFQSFSFSANPPHPSCLVTCWYTSCVMHRHILGHLTLVGSTSNTFEFESSDCSYWSAVIISCTVNVINEKICKCVWTDPIRVACMAHGLEDRTPPNWTHLFSNRKILMTRVVIMCFSANFLYVISMRSP